MKKLVMFFFIISSLLLSVGVSSCEKQDLNFYDEPMFVNEVPKELENNRNQVYVDLSDLQKVEYVGNFAYQSMDSYRDEYGRMVIVYYNSNIELYKITARKYCGWLNNVQYALTNKEYYQISAQALTQIRARLKNTQYAICYKQIVTGDRDQLGLGAEITGVIE